MGCKKIMKINTISSGSLKCGPSFLLYEKSMCVVWTQHVFDWDANKLQSCLLENISYLELIRNITYINRVHFIRDNNTVIMKPK